MSKSLLYIDVYIDFFNHKDRRSLYRHIRIMILKNLKDVYGYILTKDERNIIANILSVKSTDAIYKAGKIFISLQTNKLVNHIGLMLSIDRSKHKYNLVNINDETLSYFTKIRNRYK